MLILIYINSTSLKVSRDPNKRRIKPNQSILSFDQDLDDSESDDSDYKPTNVEDDDVEFESDTENKPKDGHSVQNGNDDVEHETSSSDESDESDDSNNDSQHSDRMEFDQTCTTNDTLFKSELLLSKSSHLSTNGIDLDSNTKLDPIQQQQSRINNLKKILVCSVCLGDVSRNEDEIVECDSCGISVHELCYGITADDAESIHSNASSSSTEPWFCDACKAGIKNPVCLNTPNSIYKQITKNFIIISCVNFVPIWEEFTRLPIQEDGSIWFAPYIRTELPLLILKNFVDQHYHLLAIIDGVQRVVHFVKMNVTVLPAYVSVVMLECAKLISMLHVLNEMDFFVLNTPMKLIHTLSIVNFIRIEIQPRLNEEIILL